MNAEEFLTTFKRRGFQVRLVDGALRVDPFPKLTPADRVVIAEVAADTGARSTLKRLLRERAGNSGDPAKPTEATKPATKLAESDALLVREAQRKFPGSPLVGLRSPGPRRRKDRAQSAAVETLEAHRFDEIAGPRTQNEPAPAQSDSSTVEPVPVTLEIVAREVVEPSTQDETARLALEIDSPEPEPEAPAADPDVNSEQSHETDTSSPEPAYQVQAHPAAGPTRIFITVKRVRSNDRGPGIEVEICPSPSTTTDGIRFTIERDDPSIRHRFKPRRLLVDTRLEQEGFRFFRAVPGLRLAIEFER